jgi:hypothetical protein
LLLLTTATGAADHRVTDEESAIRVVEMHFHRSHETCENVTFRSNHCFIVAESVLPSLSFKCT